MNLFRSSSESALFEHGPAVPFSVGKHLMICLILIGTITITTLTPRYPDCTQPITATLPSVCCILPCMPWILDSGPNMHQLYVYCMPKLVRGSTGQECEAGNK